MTSDGLFRKVLAGDEIAREKFAKEKLTLVKLRVAKFILRHPAAEYFREELFGIASLTLARCLKRACDASKKPIANFDGYASRCIDRDLCAKWSEEEFGAVRVPARTIQRHRRKNSDEPQRWPQQEQILRPDEGPTGEEILRSDMDSLPTLSDSSAEFETMDEILNGCCRTDVERQLIAGLARGESVTDMAAELDVDEATIETMRMSVLLRYQQRDAD